MASANFDAEVSLVLAHEGGYTNHPADPGGPTNRGITIYDARRYAAEFGWIVGRTVSIEDMRALPLWFAKVVYRRKYWDAQLLDMLEPGVDYCMLDYGIHSGIGRSGRVLRRILGMSDTASQVTLEVVDIANRRPARELIADMCDERLRYLKSLKTWQTFGKGWGRRVVEVRAYALDVADDLVVEDAQAPSIVPAPGRAIDPDKFARVRALQQVLADAGLYDGAVDGDLGPKTVRAFQQWKQLRPVDGVVGPITRPMLDAELARIALPAAS